MKLGGKNKHKSKIGDCHNRTGSAHFGGVGEGSNLEKLEKMREKIFVTYERVITS